MHEFEDMVSKPFVAVEAEVDFSKILTFDEMYIKWYKLQMASKRWTHKASIQRPLGAYQCHAQKAFGYMHITDVTRRVVFGTLQQVFL